MLQNPRKTLGFKKNMVYEIPPGGGGGEGKPYPASGLQGNGSFELPQQLMFKLMDKKISIILHFKKIMLI